MNNLSILLIDDEQTQVESLKKAICSKYNDGISVFTAHEEGDILNKLENCYYDIAIVDLRMSEYSINGFDIIKQIREISPYAKIIAVSAYSAEYQNELNEILKEGNILGFIDKTSFSIFSKNIFDLIDSVIYKTNSEETSNLALKEYYSNLKNLSHPYQKGLRFEYFVTMLFVQLCVNKIINLLKDKSTK